MLDFFGCAGSSAVEPLSWDIRLKIAIGAARGLAFLHTSDKKVIYRDFKASNILLDGVRIYMIVPRKLMSWILYLCSEKALTIRISRKRNFEYGDYLGMECVSSV